MDIQLLIGIIVFIIIVCVGLNKMDNTQENFDTDNVLCEKSDSLDGTSNSNNCPVDPDYDPSEYAKKADLIKDCPSIPDMSEYVLKSTIPSNHRCPACICPKISANNISCGSIDEKLSKCEAKNKELHKKLDQRPIEDCSQSNCAKLAQHNPGKICSKGDKPCIYINKTVNIPKNEFSCPEIIPCVDNDKKDVVNTIQNMLKQPSNTDLTNLQQIQDLLENTNLETRTNIETELNKLKNELKRLKNKHTTTHKPHHGPHGGPHRGPHGGPDNSNNNVYNDYDYPEDYDDNKLEEKILEFEKKLKETNNNLTTPSPTQLHQLTTTLSPTTLSPSALYPSAKKKKKLEDIEVNSYDSSQLHHILNDNKFEKIDKNCLL